MNINKYPQIRPGKKLFKRVYVAIMLWTVGKAIQVAAKVDKEVKEELARLPNNFTLRMMVAPEKAFPIFTPRRCRPLLSTKDCCFTVSRCCCIKTRRKIKYPGRRPEGQKSGSQYCFQKYRSGLAGALLSGIDRHRLYA